MRILTILRPKMTLFIKLSIYYGSLKIDESRSKSAVYDTVDFSIGFSDLYAI